MNTNLHANKMVRLFGFHVKNSPLAEPLGEYTVRQQIFNIFGAD